MSEHPILFSGPMVRAILDGSKTMTRRVVKYTPAMGNPFEWRNLPESKLIGKIDRFCPYGQPGDRLWVRETWGCEGGNTVRYIADGSKRRLHHEFPSKLARFNKANKPSIFMPRWASRITLEITGVKVERVQDISEQDAEAEGISFMRDIPDADETLTAKTLFNILWDSINAKRGYGWDVNPWVWAITFRRVS